VSNHRWAKVAAGVAAGAILTTTVLSVGVITALDELEDNITVLDVSETTGEIISAHDSIVTDRTTGATAPFNVLLMGSDTREGKANQGYGNFSGARSDTTILLHVSADRSNAVAVSIPRDTTIDLPTGKNSSGKEISGGVGKFNAAMARGGPGCTLKAVTEMTGIAVNNFVVVDFGGFKAITKAVGGVEVCLSEAVNDPDSGLKLSAGSHTISGEDALSFVRARKTLANGSDTSRIRRQQAFLGSMVKQMLSSGVLLNPAALYEVLSAGTKSLTTDPQLANISNLRELAFSMVDLKPENFTFTTIPWTPSANRANVVVNQEKAAPLIEAIKNDTPWPPSNTPNQSLLVNEAIKDKSADLNSAAETYCAS